MSAPLLPPATFLLDAAGPLALPTRGPDEALWRALAYRVTRRPQALDEHVRRVRLASARASLHARAPGALADLLHVLGGRGQALAARVLADAAAVLPAPERALLAAWAAGEVPPATRTHALPGRVLPTLAPAPRASAGAAGSPRDAP